MPDVPNRPAAPPEQPAPPPDRVPTGTPPERPFEPAGPDLTPGASPMELPVPGLPPEVSPGGLPNEVPSGVRQTRPVRADGTRWSATRPGPPPAAAPRSAAPVGA